MAEYLVSFECVWSTVVEADSDEEAEEIAASRCPWDIDGEGCVTKIEEEEDEDSTNDLDGK